VPSGDVGPVGRAVGAAEETVAEVAVAVATAEVEEPRLPAESLYQLATGSPQFADGYRGR
jgi:hypothetical protein